MFWAGFGQNIQTGLVPLHGSVDSGVIQDLYRAWLPQFVFDGDIFMHDNAPVHTAHVVCRVLKEM